MAQFAAQDYFARLSSLSQLSFPPTDFVGSCTGIPKDSPISTSNSNSGSGKAKNKSKEKTSQSYNKSSVNHLRPSSSATSSLTLEDYKSLYDRSNLQKDLFNIQSSSSSSKGSRRSNATTHDVQQNHNKQRKDYDTSNKYISSLNSHNITISPAPSSTSSTNSSKDFKHNSTTFGSARTKEHEQKTLNKSSPASLNEMNFDSSLSVNALNSLSQLGNLNLTSQQSVTAAMNALAASSTKAKEYVSSGILRYNNQ